MYDNEEEDRIEIDPREIEKDKHAERINRKKKDKNKSKNKWQDGGRKPKRNHRNRNDERAALRDLVNQYR